MKELTREQIRRDYDEAERYLKRRRYDEGEMTTRWQEQCLLCGKVVADDLVGIQEHVMYDHGYSPDDLRNATKRETDGGFIWTMPDGRDWLVATRAR